MGFSRQEYWNGLPCPPPGDLPDQGIEPGSLALQADALPSEPPRGGSPPENSRVTLADGPGKRGWRSCSSGSGPSHCSLPWTGGSQAAFQTHWTADCQAPLSMGFSRQEYWSGMPCPPPGDLPNPGIGPHLLCLLHWQGRFFTTRATWEAHNVYIHQNTVLYTSNIYKF